MKPHGLKEQGTWEQKGLKVVGSLLPKGAGLTATRDRCTPKVPPHSTAKPLEDEEKIRS